MTARSVAAACSDIEPIDGVRVRPWHVDDAAVLVTAWQDMAIAAWNPVPPEPTLELARNWIGSTAEQTTLSIGIDVVLVGDTNAVMGEIGFQIDRSQQIAEVGFWLGAGHRGSGNGRALLALAKKLASTLQLRGLVALVDPVNTAAVALLERCNWSEIPTTSQRRAFAVGV